MKMTGRPSPLTATWNATGLKPAGAANGSSSSPRAWRGSPSERCAGALPPQAASANDTTNHTGRHTRIAPTVARVAAACPRSTAEQRDDLVEVRARGERRLAALDRAALRGAELRERRHAEQERA